VIDALLGAAALGDVGLMFPDTDPENRGRDSAQMLTAALDAVAALGWKVVNIDCIVFASAPSSFHTGRSFVSGWPISSASRPNASDCRPRPGKVSDPWVTRKPSLPVCGIVGGEGMRGTRNWD